MRLLSFLMLLLSSCLNEEIITDENKPPGGIANLDIQIQYPSTNVFDSVRIIFKNGVREIKKKLMLDSTTYIASGSVTNIPRGSWNISISFFKTVVENYKSLETTAVVHLEIPSTASRLISKQDVIFINEENNKKPLLWDEYYYYQLHVYSDHAEAADGFLRLPLDPTEPFIEIATFSPKWIYAYADRSFYNRSLDNNDNYYQGGAAFEVYGKSGSTHDRLDRNIIDTTSFVAGISSVREKEWNYVDCLVIVSGTDSAEGLLIYHVWDLRNLITGSSHH